MIQSDDACRNGNSASCKERHSPICAAKARSNCSRWIFLVTRSVDWPSANRMTLPVKWRAKSQRLLPQDRPRYLMGVGRPEQLADYVRSGHRHDGLRASYTRCSSRLLVHQRRPRADQECALHRRPARHSIRNCSCSVCRRYTRAYLRHLFAAGEITAAILATHHNVHFYLDIMRQIREAIRFGHLQKFASGAACPVSGRPALNRIGNS